MEHHKSQRKIKDYFEDASILFIDDSLLDHELIRMVFRRYEMDNNLEFASSAETGLDIMKRQNIRAVFVNQILPGMDGFGFLREMKKRGVRIPVIMMMSTGNEEMSLRALREGAHDCLIKGVRYFDSLPLILDRALARHELELERAERDNLIIESQRHWIAMFDAITDFIFMTDAERTIIKANRALSAAFGKLPKDIIGMKCHELFGINPEESCIPNRSGQPHTEERNINDEIYLISSFPLDYGDKPLTIYVMKDITEMKRLKDQLYHSDKLASLGLLVSGVAHEINNPLTGIIAYTEILRMKFPDREMEKELRKILESADRCKKIVANLLTFSRQKTPSRTLESINDIIERAIELRIYWLRSSNIEIVRDYDIVKSVFVDSQQIQQVILNILLNAEQAISEHNRNDGAIVFSTRLDKAGQRVIVRISDNGPGIPRDIIPRIFDPFFTTKPVGSGTGLGLSISHGIITEHGGSITVESTEGEGTTFTIELPLPARIEGNHVTPDYRNFFGGEKAVGSEKQTEGARGTEES